MNRERDRPLRVLLVSALVAVGCSLMVTAAVSYFRPMQAAYAALERNRVLIEAAGLTDAAASLSDREVATLFRRLEIRAVDLRSGKFTDDVDPLGYDFDAAATSADGSTPLPESSDIASIGRRPNYMPVYFRGSPNDPECIVLPVYGQGMWSTIRAFIALGPDGNIIQALVIQDHAETPGIGDRIEDRAWLASWTGKPVFDQRGVAIQLAKTGTAAGPNSIDGISGATITARALVMLVQFWLGENGYGPLLENLRKGAG
ncbi:MAG: NADH:ubiquinone reductase (Na(+)-transporting) subunit C [Xanthomonadales bacterium]|nr:NADH:ubiquinone reductase (Na(+)-transporting) subunit C [Xanthomonadales bacterium]